MGERVTFRSSTGPNLAGVIDVPAGAIRGWGVFAHGFTLGKDCPAAARICKQLAADGIGMLRFDALGLGASDGDWGDGSFTVKVDDIVKACEFMADNATPADILVGHSWGGAAVLSAARHSPGVRSVVTVAAPVDPGHVEKHYDAVVELRVVRGQRRVDDRRPHADPQKGVRRRRPRCPWGVQDQERQAQSFDFVVQVSWRRPRRMLF